MLDHHRSVKRAAARIGVPTVFRRSQGVSLSDFLENVINENDDPFSVAGKLFEYLCLEDGRYNEFTPGIALIAGYLAEHLQVELDVQALKDLKQITDTCPTAIAVQGWAQSL